MAAGRYSCSGGVFIPGSAVIFPIEGASVIVELAGIAIAESVAVKFAPFSVFGITENVTFGTGFVTVIVIVLLRVAPSFALQTTVAVPVAVGVNR